VYYRWVLLLRRCTQPTAVVPGLVQFQQRGLMTNQTLSLRDPLPEYYRTICDHYMAKGRGSLPLNHSGTYDTWVVKCICDKAKLSSVRALKRQIAAPPFRNFSTRVNSATGVRNDESSSVAARPFACILSNNMRPLCGKGSWQSALKSFGNLRHIGCKMYLR